ncbi:hypothetical protein B0O99DRAFT_686434 [Bisporella sp. PMI_857]|nr:hypothetical protein B0O99DRAFT_686434 [Bisporella sp. PMI_857]
MDNGGNLDLVQTILTGLGLLAVIAAVVTFATERIRRVRENDERYATTSISRMGCFRKKRPNVFHFLLGRNTPVLMMPSLEGLFEAADQGLWTSSSLDHMNDLQTDLTWVPLYESVFEELAHQDLPKPWKQDELVMGIFNSIKGSNNRHCHSSEYFEARHRLLKSKRLVSCVRKLPQVTTTPSGTAPTSNFTSLGIEHGLTKRKAVIVSGKKPSISVSREEFVALALMTGMRVERSAHGLHYSGIGPFGLTSDLIHTDANWMLSLIKGTRIPRHAPSMGSGYTFLMAKHLACGTIPFMESPSWVKCVYMTDSVLNGVKSGRCIIDERSYGGRSLEFLRRLPAEKAVDAYYGLKDNVQDTPGAIFDAHAHIEVAWSRLIAGVAFGGLVPQAHPNVKEAVKYTVAGTSILECIQNLEALIDELHMQTKDRGLSLFGSEVAKRCEAKVYVTYTFPSTASNPRDAAAVFARYMNLLECLVAIIHEKTLPRPSSGVQSMEKVFEKADVTLDRVYRAHVKPMTGRTSSEQTLVDQDLGKTVSDITSSIKANGTVSLDQCGELLRCILAAWAVTVPIVLVMEDAIQSNQIGSVPGTIIMDSLPPVVSLG